MQGTPIHELTVQSLQGDFYELFKKYIEKHGGIWSEQRATDQLQSVHIQFPHGTVSTDLPPGGYYDRRQITFTDGAIMFWYHQRNTGLNSISVPYVYL